MISFAPFTKSFKSFIFLYLLFSGRRINKDDIKETFDWLNKDQTRTYICGPSPMIADMEHLLIEQGLNKQSILYEKWW
jgi:ferredoxin-NADP reductase